MFLKPGVDISKICPEIGDRLEALDEIHKAYLSADLRITSGHEGKSGDGIHSIKSLHYKKRAIDIGWTFTIVNLRTVTAFFIKLLRIFPRSLFDVMFEINHIHIEYDPK